MLSYLKHYNRHKLDFHTQKWVFLGYSLLHKGYNCQSKIGKMYISASITFDESNFPFYTNFDFASHISSVFTINTSNLILSVFMPSLSSSTTTSFNLRVLPISSNYIGPQDFHSKDSLNISNNTTNPIETLVDTISPIIRITLIGTISYYSQNIIYKSFTTLKTITP